MEIIGFTQHEEMVVIVCSIFVIMTNTDHSSLVPFVNSVVAKRQAKFWSEYIYF